MGPQAQETTPTLTAARTTEPTKCPSTSEFTCAWQGRGQRSLAMHAARTLAGNAAHRRVCLFPAHAATPASQELLLVSCTSVLFKPLGDSMWLR